MPDMVPATACPHCGKDLRIPNQFFGKVLRCKACHKTFVAGQFKSDKPTSEAPCTPKPITTLTEPAKPAGLKSPPPADEPSAPSPPVEPAPSPFVQQLVQRQRSGTTFFVFLLFLVVAAMGAGGFIFREQLLALYGNLTRPQAAPQTQPEPQTRPPLIDKGLLVDERSGDLTSLPSKAEAGKKPHRSFARIPGPYPGRALLIGVRNYLYLNPINPGYRPERSFQRDPLGLLSLRRVLVTEHSFPREQTAVLSDVDDQKPLQPTKAMIEANIDEFLKSSRPSDRIILAFVGHATVLNEQAYLLPIDAELPQDDSKPDAARDAKLAQHLVPVKWLYEKLAASPARQKLLILDIAQNDPEAGLIRNAPGALNEKLHARLKATPVGTQVWLACGPNQHSYQFHTAGQDGSVFMDILRLTAVLTTDKNWKLIEKDPGLKNGRLPLVLLAAHVNQETAAYIKLDGKRRGAGPQTPELLGATDLFSGTPPTEPPPPVSLTIIKPADDLVPTEEIDALVKELDLNHDPARALPPSSFPPMSRVAFSKYAPDYQNPAEMETKAKGMPFRAATLKAIRVLNKSEKSFRMRFPAPKDEAPFKKMVEREQEAPAYATAELSDILDEMKALADRRDEETSPRWLAHFDYTQARVLAKLAYVQEYGFVLGNKLRKETPKIKDPAHNGWVLVPQRKLEQKETRTYESERQKLASRIIKENPGTPWEVLARREQATILGLTLQEASLEELERAERGRR